MGRGPGAPPHGMVILGAGGSAPTPMVWFNLGAGGWGLPPPPHGMVLHGSLAWELEKHRFS